MTGSVSWHIPHIPPYGAPPALDILFVLFLEKLPKHTRSEIIGNLETCDEEWGKSFNVNVPLRKLRPVPWIRNYWPSSEAILQYASRHKPTGARPQDLPWYKSYILIDSGWEASTCIVATWITGDKEDEHVMVAARVPMAIANLVLTMIDRDVFSDAANPLKAALGDDAYEQNQVDFYKDHKVIEPFPEPAPYAPPSFLPKDLRLSNTSITIISLLHLEQDMIEDLTLRIKIGSGLDTMPKFQFINWEGDPPTRQQLVKLFDWIDSNSVDEDKIGYAFFVDNILQEWTGQDGGKRKIQQRSPPIAAGHANKKKTEKLVGPQIIAVSRTDHYSAKIPDHQISLLPIKPEGIVPIWRSACQSSQAKSSRTRENRVAPHAVEAEHGNIYGRERVIDLEYQPLSSSDSMDSFATVWFLRSFTLSEERHIRRAFTALYSIEENQDWGKEFAYLAYPSTSPIPPSTSPSEKRTHTLHDLTTLFQTCDPFSPSYSPTHTPTLRLTSYPHHFFAVDDKVFDREPQVWLASSIDFYHESNELGWLIGYIPAREAGSLFTNLAIANVGPSEVIKGECGKVWLGDVTPGDPDVEEEEEEEEEEE